MFDWGQFVIGFLAVLATIISAIGLISKGRGENKNAAAQTKIALDARIDARVKAQLEDAWTEIDGLKTEAGELRTEVGDLKTRQTRRDGAITRILKAIASQWPDTAGPNLDPADIAEVQETIPTSWIRNSRSNTGPTPTKKEPTTS